MGETEKEREWRTEHLMHRIRAALDTTSLLDETLTTHDSASYNRKLSLDLCAEQARHEGHIAALRWLIDFVGINAAEDLQPKRPPTWRSTSEDLSRFGQHQLIPIPSDDATFLAKMWKACSQATGHPTSGTNHESLEEPNRRRAMEIRSEERRVGKECRSRWVAYH